MGKWMYLRNKLSGCKVRKELTSFFLIYIDSCFCTSELLKGPNFLSANIWWNGSHIPLLFLPLVCIKKGEFGPRERYILELIYLESGINVAPWINIAPGKFVKKNKRSPIYTLYLYYLNRLYGVRNKAVAPGKKSKN